MIRLRTAMTGEATDGDSPGVSTDGDSPGVSTRRGGLAMGASDLDPNWTTQSHGLGWALATAHGLRSAHAIRITAVPQKERVKDPVHRWGTRSLFYAEWPSFGHKSSRLDQSTRKCVRMDIDDSGVQQVSFGFPGLYGIVATKDGAPNESRLAELSGSKLDALWPSVPEVAHESDTFDINLLYGEIADSITCLNLLKEAMIYLKAAPRTRVFSDLGAGLGKPVVIAAMSGIFSKSVGIELRRDLIVASRRIWADFACSLGSDISDDKPICSAFNVLGSILDRSVRVPV